MTTSEQLHKTKVAHFVQKRCSAEGSPRVSMAAIDYGGACALYRVTNLEQRKQCQSQHRREQPLEIRRTYGTHAYSRSQEAGGVELWTKIRSVYVVNV